MEVEVKKSEEKRNENLYRNCRIACIVITGFSVQYLPECL